MPDESTAREVWSCGVESELAFWDSWFRTKGREWPADYRERLDPMQPLSEYHCALIDHVPGDEVRILDVGAGPLTKLGKTHPRKKIVIVATDALAVQYAALLAKYAINPPVRTILADAEHLTERFPEDSFDFVNAQNCLDHTYDPVEAIRQMIHIVRPECFIALNHAENEADNENWEGLHQWNFAIEAGRFIIRGRTSRCDVNAEVSALADCECRHTQGSRWVQVHLRKRA